MNIEHNFLDSYIKGQAGEEVIKNWLEKRKNISKVIDVRQNFIYQKKDIDFIVEKQDKQYFIELKTDYRAHETQNLFFEIISNNIKNTKGCIYTSQADYLLYLIPKMNVLYVIKLKQLIFWLKEQNFNKRQANNKFYYSEGYIVPINFFETNFNFYTKITPILLI